MKKFILILFALFTLHTSCSKYNSPEQTAGLKENGLVRDWIQLQLRLIRNTTGISHPAYSRHFAYTGVALFESVAAAEKSGKSIAPGLNGALQLPVAPAAQLLFAPAAANATLAAMMKYFYGNNPVNRQRIDSLEQLFNNRYLHEPADNGKITLSRQWGQQVALSVIAWSETDGASLAGIPYTLRGEGYWEPTPNGFANALLPGWGNNRTIIPGSITGTIPGPPAEFSKIPGSPFHLMVKELYDVSQSLTDEQKAIANFWDDSPNGKYVTAFGHWFSILRMVLEKENPTLYKAAKEYMHLGICMNEATISCWKTKYQYSLLRPVSYIRKYMGYPGWSPFISTPPHPEYSAAHATISAAAGFALEYGFGKNYSFVDQTYEDIGMGAKNYRSFEQAGMEAGISRLYGGIHYRPSIETGNLQGRKVAENVCHFLKSAE